MESANANQAEGCCFRYLSPGNNVKQPSPSNSRSGDTTNDPQHNGIQCRKADNLRLRRPKYVPRAFSLHLDSVTVTNPSVLLLGLAKQPDVSCKPDPLPLPHPSYIYVSSRLLMPSLTKPPLTLDLLTPIAYWPVVEASLQIVTACLPMLRHVFQDALRGAIAFTSLNSIKQSRSGYIKDNDGSESGMRMVRAERESGRGDGRYVK